MPALNMLVNVSCSWRRAVPVPHIKYCLVQQLEQHRWRWSMHLPSVDAMPEVWSERVPSSSMTAMPLHTAPCQHGHL